MTALIFLGIALAVSLLGCLVLWARTRQPRSMDAHIRDFARELDALSPGGRSVPRRRPPRNRQSRGPGPG